MTTITLPKNSNLPELPETMKMVPLNAERTIYKAIPQEEEDKGTKQKVDEHKEESTEDISYEQVLVNHEQRLQAIESALSRIRGAI